MLPLAPPADDAEEPSPRRVAPPPAEAPGPSAFGENDEDEDDTSRRRDDSDTDTDDSDSLFDDLTGPIVGSPGDGRGLLDGGLPLLDGILG